MSPEAWTAVGLAITTIGQVLMAYWMYHVKHSINGMRARLEKDEYERGGRDEKARDKSDDPSSV